MLDRSDFETDVDYYDYRELLSLELDADCSDLEPDFDPWGDILV